MSAGQHLYPFPPPWGLPRLSGKVTIGPHAEVPLAPRLLPIRRAELPPWRVVFAISDFRWSPCRNVFEHHRRHLQGNPLLRPVWLTGDTKNAPYQQNTLVLSYPATSDPSNIPGELLRRADVICDPAAFVPFGKQTPDTIREPQERARKLLAQLAPNVVVIGMCPEIAFAANEARVPLIVEWWFGTPLDTMTQPADVILSVTDVTTRHIVGLGRRPFQPVETCYVGVEWFARLLVTRLQERAGG